MKEETLSLKMPRWGLPLYAQVLIWFFINVALVFLVLWVVLKFQFGVSVAGIFHEELRQRVEPRAELVAAELRESALTDWKGVLSVREKELGVRLAVLTLAGEWTGQLGLPDALVEEAEAKFGMNADRESWGPPPDGKGPNRQGGPRGPGGREREDLGFGGPERGPRDVEEVRRQPFPRLLVGREARMTFSSLGAQGGRWAGTEIYLGGETFRHPPRGLLVMYVDQGAKSEIFVDWKPLVILGVGLLLFSGLVWLPFVHRVTKRLRLMTEGAERISEGDFEVNVASNRGDEIGGLSRVIQRMSVRLNQLVEGQKRFLGDTAHELCSPLVRIRMGLGVLEQQLEGKDRDRLEAVESEVGELARLVDELLEFSKASLAKGDLNLESVILRELCSEVSQKEALGNECEVVGGLGLEIETNPDLLKRALGNLVRNSARYGEGKPLQVKIEKHGGEVWIGVLDRGPGLPDGWAERVFEPFARPEEARTREGGGAGLGLAIVKTCAESLSGRVFCRNRETGGLEVVLVIPADR